MSPDEVISALKLHNLKDKVWYVAPSVATDGTGIFEGLVSYPKCRVSRSHLTPPRHGSQTTSRSNNPLNEPRSLPHNSRVPRHGPHVQQQKEQQQRAQSLIFLSIQLYHSIEPVC